MRFTDSQTRYPGLNACKQTCHHVHASFFEAYHFYLQEEESEE